MKKIIALVVCVLMVVAVFASCAATGEVKEQVEEKAEEVQEEVAEAVEEAVEEEVEEEAGEVLTLEIGFYADANDSYYQLMDEAFEAMAEADPECDWTVNYVIGDNTATMQVKTVEDFITAGYDAVICIQNSADATSECIAKCVDAGIPYFGAAHSFLGIDNFEDAAGSCCYDFVEGGYYAGEDAAERGVTKIVNIQGVLGQGSAAAQTQGLLEGLADGGLELGAEIEDIMEKELKEEDLDDHDVAIVYWAAGNWAPDPAQKAMADAITALGADGFDGAYVHNDPMCEGAIAAMEDAGLDPADYWLGSCNGREISWQWAKDGIISVDVNQGGALEGAVIYQQVKAFFNGEDYKQYVHPYLIPYTKETIEDVEDTLIPCSDIDAFMAKVEDGSIDVDLNSDQIVEFA